MSQQRAWWQDPYTGSISNLIGMPFLYPKSTTIGTKGLDPSEYSSLKRWFDSRVSKYTTLDPVVGQNFANHLNFFTALWMIAKAKFQQVSAFPPSDQKDIRSPQIPGVSQIGIQDILPEDVYRNQTGSGSTTGPTTWDINTLVAGTTVYLLGDSVPTYFKTTGTEPNRYILGIIKNGFVEVGANTPVLDQMYYSTKQDSFNPFTINSLFQISEVQNKSIYSYDTPGAILLDEVVNATMTAMPKYAGNSRIAFIGCKVYEYNQYTALSN